MGIVADDPFFRLRTLRAAADGSHTSGAMIALMPTEEDAERLALPGGEDAGELHLTLFFLGEGEDWSEDQRTELISLVRSRLEAEPPGAVQARVFGANHWNAGSPEPCWVLGVGDDRDSEGARLEDLHRLATDALEDRHGPDDLPVQHAPWAPHICVAYSGDTSLIKSVATRMGPVTFDRVRLAFGGEHTDIPLGSAVTAAAGPLRRQPRPDERFTDFTRMQGDWESAVDAVMADLEPLRQQQIETLTGEVQAAAELGDLDLLNALALDAAPVEAVLIDHMVRAAQQAGEAQQKEAEEQGVAVPDWELGGAVTAAVGLDLLRSIAGVTARILNSSLVQSAVRRALELIGRPQVSPVQVGEEVGAHLVGLSDAGPRVTVGGAITAAQNEGRRTVLEAAPPARVYTASEILDRNVCGPCRDIDGTEFETLADSLVAYPAGGYTACLGGPRCRGTVVALWEEET
jgi:2'-5' RNA ligase